MAFAENQYEIEYKLRPERVPLKTRMRRMAGSLLTVGGALFICRIAYTGFTQVITATDLKALYAFAVLWTSSLFLLGAANIWRVVTNWAWYLFGHEHLYVNAESITLVRYMGWLRVRRLHFTTEDVMQIQNSVYSADWVSNDSGFIIFRPVYHGGLLLRTRYEDIRFGCMTDAAEQRKMGEEIRVYLKLGKLQQGKG